jgi:CelD/BcsL family acetyltransferase involved in cellulose biosynthesis
VLFADGRPGLEREREADDGRVTVKVRVVRPSDLGTHELDAWRAFQRDDVTLASPFLSPEFARAVDTARDDARVAVVEDAGGAPVAFFAFSVGEKGDGAPIGSTICDAQALVAHPGFDWDPVALVRAAGLESWSFDHLVATQDPFAPFYDTVHRSPIADLSQGHAAYLEQVRVRSKDVLAQTARRRRKLGREVGDVVVEWQAADPGTLDLLLSWKSAQYRETGVWDRFDQPWIVEVVRALAATTSEGLTGVVSTLRAGEELVALHFGLLGRDRLAWWFPAYDPSFGRYSPGLILLVDLVAECAARGLGLVDLGRGEHHYKLRVATGAYEVAEGTVPATTS